MNVKCVAVEDSGGRLKLHQVYEVKQESKGHYMLDNDKSQISWAKWRFEPTLEKIK